MIIVIHMHSSSNHIFDHQLYNALHHINIFWNKIANKAMIKQYLQGED